MRLPSGRDVAESRNVHGVSAKRRARTASIFGKSGTLRALVIGTLLVGCSLMSLDDLTRGLPTDGGSDDAATEHTIDDDINLDAALDVLVDANTRCSPDAPFGKPQVVPGLDALEHAGSARFTDDELIAYLHSDTDIHVARRASRDHPFDAPTRLVESVVNSSSTELHPFPSPNALKLWFTSSRSGARDLYVASRTSTSMLFSDLAEVPGVNTSEPEQAPWLSPDESELFFASQRSDGAGGYDLYRAEWEDASYGAPIPLTELNTSAVENLPVVSRDGTRIFFSSSRAGGLGGIDIWTASRSDPKGAFSAPENVHEFNSTATEWVSWISPDGCRVYLDSDRSGRSIVYVATRLTLAE